MKKIFLIAAAAMALVACDNDNNILNEPIEVRISASIGKSSSSRAAGTSWAAGDKIGLTMVGRYENMEYTTESGDGNFKGTPMYFKNKVDQETLIAYYPFDGTEGTAPGVIETTTGMDVQTAEEQLKFDYLYAKHENVNGSTPAVNLEFSHRMSKISLILENGNEGTDVNLITSCTINGLVLEGTFDTSSGVCAAKEVDSEALTIDLSGAEALSEEEPAQTSRNLNPLIVFPQNPEDESVTMKLSDSDNQTYTCVLKFGENGIEAGNNYQYTIKVNKTGLIVNAEIKDWETVTLSSEAKPED